MLSEDQFNAYLKLCEEMAERLYREGIWPWRDSTDAEDLLESEHNQ